MKNAGFVVCEKTSTESYSPLFTEHVLRLLMIRLRKNRCIISIQGLCVFSLGSVGCTFRCDHCQNYTISMARPEELSLQDIPPEKVSEIAI